MSSIRKLVQEIKGKKQLGEPPNKKRHLTNSDEFIPLSKSESDEFLPLSEDNKDKDENEEKNDGSEEYEEQERPTKGINIGDDFIPLGGSQRSKRDSIGDNQKTLDINRGEPSKNHLPVWIPPPVSPDKLRLEKEIWHFYEWIRPTNQENMVKEHIISEVESVVKNLWSNASVQVFGSHFTGIALPTSDIDLLVSDAGHPDNDVVWHPDPLTELYNELRANHADKISSIKLIANARVPIIKLVSSKGEVKVDISVAANNGPVNTQKVKKYLQEMPELRPLIFVLKQFLHQFALNDTFSGGIGSYALTIMAISLLQLRKAASRKNGDNFVEGEGTNWLSRFGRSDELGVILLEFFELYGRLFNYRKYGISVRGPGRYFSKKKMGWYVESSPDALCLEDPHDPQNDVGRNSYQITTIRSVFYNAFVRLTIPDLSPVYPLHEFPTMLSRVLEVDREVLSRRDKLHKAALALQNTPNNGNHNDNNKQQQQQQNNTPNRQIKIHKYTNSTVSPIVLNPIPSRQDSNKDNKRKWEF